MASLRKHPRSKYWLACFTDSTGKQRQWSTRFTHSDKNWSEAMKMAEGLEKAYQGKLTEQQFRDCFAKIQKELNMAVTVSPPTFAEHLTNWLNAKQAETEGSTKLKYDNVVSDLRGYFHNKLNKEISSITYDDLIGFRDSLAARLASSTTNHKIKVVRMIFKDALDRGLLTSSPAARIKLIKETDRPEGNEKKRSFTPEEASRLLHFASEEWKGMILAGLYTGQRLGDIANLTWQRIDLQADVIQVVTMKTKRLVRVPIAAPLRRYLETHESYERSSPLFPACLALYKLAGQTRLLSAEFHKILVKAGLAEPYSHKATGEGRSAPRKTKSLSFHSLRRTATTFLWQAKVERDTIMDIVGHDTVEMSQLYTDKDDSLKRDALKKMLDITNL